ncbi:MAG: hypothetical protein M1837_000101 [Sclerophora amabilis]|nr:MAG: hypothetical protein M1837_000101 [Sclerophora amabilis]
MSNSITTTLSPNSTNILSEYDHQILLVDGTQQTESSRPSRKTSPSRTDSSSLAPTPTGASTPNPNAAGISKRWTLREELARRKYSKWQESKYADKGGLAAAENLDGASNEQDGNIGDQQGAPVSSQVEDFAAGGSSAPKNAFRKVTGRVSRRQKPIAREKKGSQAIDVLYENQRGWFFCGIPLFSHNSLLNFDPSPWESVAFKPSPVDITNAQLPDPSWEWTWRTWYVDMSPDVDEEGWQYSFSFSPAFSWHGTHVWFHSFVRRRRWLRKRAKRGHHRGLGELGGDMKMQEGHMLNSDYFTIHPKRARSPSSSITDGQDQLSAREYCEEEELRDIRDIGSLMKALKTGVIDREKIDALEEFIHQGGEEIYYLTERMHDIMSSFIFQASRRQLLAHLVQHYNESLAEAGAESKAKEDEQSDEGESGPTKKESKRASNLYNAIQAAEEQVKTLEYWSDVKHLAKQGESLGAVDKSKGWDDSWQGLDSSGPANFDTGARLPIGDQEREKEAQTEHDQQTGGEGNGETQVESAPVDKGKARA